MKDFRHKNGLVILTLACPIECGHCIFSCTRSKDPRKWMPEKTIRRVAEEFHVNKINKILITGGEPFYDLKKLFNSLRIFLNYFNPEMISIATSGFWAIGKSSTYNVLNDIRKMGIKRIEVSWDRFHAKRVKLKNIENILTEAKKLQMEVCLRPIIDMESSAIKNKIKQLILKYSPAVAFAITEPIGRAAIFDKRLLGTNENLNGFISEIENYAKIWRGKNYPLVVTTFPNGNVYGCCNAFKLAYMGNINNQQLKPMIQKIKTTLPGYIFLNNLSCSFLDKFIPSTSSHKCDLCANQPFDNKISGEECHGRKFIEMSIKDLEKCEKYDNKYELLLSFSLTIDDLKKENGKKIVNFLNSLKREGVKVKLSRPLPKCMFQPNEISELKEFNIVYNCFECNELFSIKNEMIQFCPNVYKIKGPKFEGMKDRKELFEHFKRIHNELELEEKCLNCIYLKRGQCNAICFRKK